MLKRENLLKQIKTALKSNKVVALLGPRQCGKTTLARMISRERKGEYFDLENPLDVSRLSEPVLTLEGLSGLVILDEIQRKPELFEVLRVLVDQPSFKAKFLLLGSASPHLVKNTSETLAGRVSFVDMSGFNLIETGSGNLKKLWLRGGFPRSYLARNNTTSIQWRRDFIRTFLERDIPQLGITIPSETLLRFWTMLAHYHGQIWNSAEFARSLGASEATARRYLDLLSGAYVIRQLQPWHENLGKRQVKAQKVYIRDTGLLHALLSLNSEREVLSHPKAGASWEGFIIENLLNLTGNRDAYYWRTYAGAELDLMLMARGKRIGVEVKRQDAPGMTKSMYSALKDLNLIKIVVIYPGEKTYSLHKNISVMPVQEALSVLCK